jgi:hypothetical protein
VASHVRSTGRFAVRALMAMCLFVGGLVAVQLLTGKQLLTFDENNGLTIMGRLTLTGHPPRTDGGLVEPLPADTRADVAVDLEPHGNLPGDLVLDSELKPGGGGSFIALDGAWTATPQGLEARVFGRLQAEGARPRATLEEPSFRLRDLTAEVRVQVSPAPPAGYAPKAPRALLFFHGEEILLELSMELGDAPVYRLRNLFTTESGATRTEQAGTPELNPAVPPPPGNWVVLRLVSKGGFVTVLADNKPILPKPLKLRDGLLNQLGRIGLGCEEARCRFQVLHVEGTAEKGRALLEDDVHDHTVHGTPQAQAPTAP